MITYTDEQIQAIHSGELRAQWRAEDLAKGILFHFGCLLCGATFGPFGSFVAHLRNFHTWNNGTLRRGEAK